MELKVFDGVDKSELSMIEVAHAILEQRGDIIDFSDLVNQIQNFLEKADSDIRDILPQFYTDLNIDGSFISLGDNRWGLRAWYPIDSIDEEISSIDEDDEDTPHRKKRKKVNAFLGVDVDYNDDDPEDADIHQEEDDELYDDDELDDDKEIKEYTSDLSEIGADNDLDEDDIPEGVEEDLTIVDDSEDSLDFDEDEDELNDEER
ncbi:DNA-directed RNA polymerase subunit delta [Vagococcus acidifermentans]|uniref:Probable DNA-directed RNA polymerase subunit delta n=1 Tax=Vagococcus acidifermentans TaxID=564710 RepID=A0A430AS94_9ENTE|nr:DNA-directed RNA polymerase subunit delta [Vagococcus acidifermentans]RSU10935.1 DNA-directed RNA polymerase subunit delta [Vagococcus acidifermentans]